MTPRRQTQFTQLRNANRKSSKNFIFPIESNNDDVSRKSTLSNISSPPISTTVADNLSPESEIVEAEHREEEEIAIDSLATPAAQTMIQSPPPTSTFSSTMSRSKSQPMFILPKQKMKLFSKYATQQDKQL